MITPPTNCPSCNSLLERQKDQLYCRNSNCLALTYKTIEHFARTLKIKGLGPSTITKLNLVSILDVYKLTKEYVATRLGSEKLADKLISEINFSKKRSLNDVLPAFGIPLIGKTASTKLSSLGGSIFDINKDTCKLAGLGEKATNNLIRWLETNDEYHYLPFDLEFEVETKKPSIGTICISGKLTSFPNKQKAKELLEGLGFTVKDSLTKEVSILVNESGKETAKTKKARESGVLIIENLIQYIGEFNK